LTLLLTGSAKLIWHDRVLSNAEKTRVFNIVSALLKE